jgi:molybdenum cofactor guanylyltransferase
VNGSPQRSLPLGAVLAGGAATRLGGDKAAVELDGRPLVTYPLHALRQAGLVPIVIAKPNSRLPALTYPVVIEPQEPRHPLLGVVAALMHASGRPALVVPCDVPFLSPTLLRTLADANKTTAVRAANQVHPLIALYSPESLPLLEGAVAAGQSATEALESLDPTYIEASERETFNVNTPEDLAEAAAILRQARS